MSHYIMLYKYGKQPNAWFLERVYPQFSLFVYIVGAFLIKQLFHSRLLDMRLVMGLVGYLPSHIQPMLME